VLLRAERGLLLRGFQCPDGTWICLTGAARVFVPRTRMLMASCLESNRRLVDLGSSARITKLIPIAGELTASSKHQEHEGHNEEDVIPKATPMIIAAVLMDWEERGVQCATHRPHVR
jgi:hypothetical protein